MTTKYSVFLLWNSFIAAPTNNLLKYADPFLRIASHGLLMGKFHMHP